MTVVPDGTGRIKVVLSTDDVSELGIDFNTIDCNKKETRFLLRALFKAASERAGIKESSQRLLIEAYPHIGGGGILYFTPLAKSEKKYTPPKKKGVIAVFTFFDADSMLNAIECLYSLDYEDLKSTVYETDGMFSLIIYECEMPCEIIREFCKDIQFGERAKKITCEYGKPLTGDFAIKEIGSFMVKAKQPEDF